MLMRTSGGALRCSGCAGRDCCAKVGWIGARVYSVRAAAADGCAMRGAGVRPGRSGGTASGSPRGAGGAAPGEVCVRAPSLIAGAAMTGLAAIGKAG